MSDLYKSIVSKLIEYLNGRLSTADFQDWLTPLVWDIDDSGDDAARHLLYTIELELAEFTENHRAWPDTKSRLTALLPQVASSSASPSSRA